MIRKGQLMFGGTEEMSFADQFYALAGQIRSVQDQIQNLPVFRLVVVNATKPGFDAIEIRRNELKAQLSTLNFHRFLMNHNTLIAIQPQNKL
jgi:hypothetical protein